MFYWRQLTAVADEDRARRLAVATPEERRQIEAEPRHPVADHTEVSSDSAFIIARAALRGERILLWHRGRVLAEEPRDTPVARQRLKRTAREEARRAHET